MTLREQINEILCRCVSPIIADGMTNSILAAVGEALMDAVEDSDAAYGLADDLYNARYDGLPTSRADLNTWENEKQDEEAKGSLRSMALTLLNHVGIKANLERQFNTEVTKR